MRKLFLILTMSLLLIGLTGCTEDLAGQAYASQATSGGGKLQIGDTQIYDNEINRMPDAVNKFIHIGYRDTEIVTLVPNGGKVGIGTANPSDRLSINGKASASSFCLKGKCIDSWEQVGMFLSNSS
jgi:hypothetical protein